MTMAHFHVVFMKGWCVHLSFVKECLRSVNHGQFSMQMRQDSNTTSGWKSSPAKIFHRKLLWRTPIKIHRERRRRRRQQDLQEWHRLAQRRKRRLHSDHKHVQRQRQTTITLQTKTGKESEHRLLTLHKAMRRSVNAWSLQSKLSSSIQELHDLYNAR